MDNLDNQAVLLPQKKRRVAPLVAILALAATGGLGYLSWKQHGKISATEGQLVGANNALDMLRTENKGFTDKFTTCDENLKTCADELTTGQTSLAQADNRITSAEAELSACQSSVKDLVQQQREAKRVLDELQELTGKFKGMIDAGKLAVSFRKGKMVVKLPAAILFPSGSADISENGKGALAEVAAVLKTMKGRRFTVAGHTDTDPLGKDDHFRNNWQLSAERAVVVTQTLIEKGVSAGYLVAAGYGEYDPIETNKTATGKQKNRRIEIILEPWISRELATAEIPKSPVKKKKN